MHLTAAGFDKRWVRIDRRIVRGYVGGPGEKFGEREIFGERSRRVSERVCR